MFSLCPPVQLYKYIYVHVLFYAGLCVPSTYAPRVSLCMCLCILEISKPVDLSNLGQSSADNAKTSQLQPCQPHLRRGTRRGPAKGDEKHSTSMAILNPTYPLYCEFDLPHMHYPPNQGKTKCLQSIEPQVCGNLSNATTLRRL